MEKKDIKALILDRDGTLITHIPYLHRPSQVKILPSVIDGLKMAIQANLLLFLHTNQSGIGRGMFSLDEVLACNNQMIELLGLNYSSFSETCIAPDTDECCDMVSSYRKPSPRFAREIMLNYSLQPHEICYIGDRWSDLATARNADTRAIGLTTGLENLNVEIEQHRLSGLYPVFDSFDKAINYIIAKNAD